MNGSHFFTTIFTCIFECVSSNSFRILSSYYFHGFYDAWCTLKEIFIKSNYLIFKGNHITKQYFIFCFLFFIEVVTKYTTDCNFCTSCSNIAYSPSVFCRTITMSILDCRPTTPEYDLQWITLTNKSSSFLMATLREITPVFKLLVSMLPME